MTLSYFLSGCTGITIYIGKKMAVNEIDDYFDLTDPQEEWLEPRLDYHVDHFRKDTLKEMYHILSESKGLYEDGITEQEVDIVISRFESLSERELSILLKDMVIFLAMMDDKQLYHAKKINKEREKEAQEEIAQDKLLQAKKTEDEKIKNIIENYEKWYGSLKQRQIEFIAKLYKEDPNQFNVEVKLGPEDEFAQKFAEIFSEKTDPKLRKTRLEDWKNNPAKMVGNFSLKDSFQQIKKNQRKFPKIDALMTQEQRKHFISKIESTMEKIKEYSL